jgi:hypothetical protein
MDRRRLHLPNATRRAYQNPSYGSGGLVVTFITLAATSSVARLMASWLWCRYVNVLWTAGVVGEIGWYQATRCGRASRSGEAVARGRRAFDVWCPLLSLPHLLGMEALAPPYLKAKADRVQAWRSRIGMHGRRIAIAWQGNPASPMERGRSVPLREFRPLAQVPRTRMWPPWGLEEKAAGIAPHRRFSLSRIEAQKLTTFARNGRLAVAVVARRSAPPARC